MICRFGYFQQAFKAHLSSIKKRRFLCRGKNWFRCYSWDRWGNKIELLGARVLVMNVVPELKPWHKQSRIADLETDILFVNCSTWGGSTLCPVDPVRMCAWYGWWEENTLVGQISAVILHLDRGHIWLWVVWKLCMISCDCHLIKAVADIGVWNALESLVKLNQTYLFFVKIGLVKVNRELQQAAALVASVASVALVGGAQLVIVYVS